MPLNEILRRTEDQYLQSVVLQAVTAGHLMVLCQEKENGSKTGCKTTAAAMPSPFHHHDLTTRSLRAQISL